MIGQVLKWQSLSLLMRFAERMFTHLRQVRGAFIANIVVVQLQLLDVCILKKRI